jgi:hypothetical protein
MSIGGGGEQTTNTEWRDPKMVEPKYYEAKREWVTPPAEVISQQYKDVGEQTGYGFGNKNMFGSGLMADAIARRIGESAVRSTAREDKGQYMYPQAVNAQASQNSYTTPKWSLGMGY